MTNPTTDVLAWFKSLAAAVEGASSVKAEADNLIEQAKESVKNIRAQAEEYYNQASAKLKEITERELAVAKQEFDFKAQYDAWQRGLKELNSAQENFSAKSAEADAARQAHELQLSAREKALSDKEDAITKALNEAEAARSEALALKDEITANHGKLAAAIKALNGG